ncbi:hypothetical protein IW262DRAFT_889379 [Armillaria fumosa]|nr:hypothetical protein IW262DRAFT_889379 [Armillaria fumosa]
MMRSALILPAAALSLARLGGIPNAVGDPSALCALSAIAGWPDGYSAGTDSQPGQLNWKNCYTLPTVQISFSPPRLLFISEFVFGSRATLSIHLPGRTYDGRPGSVSLSTPYVVSASHSEKARNIGQNLSGFVCRFINRWTLPFVTINGNHYTYKAAGISVYDAQLDGNSDTYPLTRVSRRRRVVNCSSRVRKDKPYFPAPRSSWRSYGSKTTLSLDAD